MKKAIIHLSISVFFISLFAAEAKPEARSSDTARWTLHSKKPAAKWRDAFVTGNGRHGTMVMGKPGEETIVCVHEELFVPAWDRDLKAVADIAHLLPKVREMIREGKSGQAGRLAVSEARKQLNPMGVSEGWSVVTHPAFDLNVSFDASGKVSKYGRRLNLETGEAWSSWADERNEVEQRVFSSRTHNVNVVELRSIGKEKLNLKLRLAERPGRVNPKKPKHRNVEMNKAFHSIGGEAEPGWLSFHADYALDRRGYEGQGRVILTGGTMEVDGDGLQIEDAERVLIVLRIEPLAHGKKRRTEELRKELETLPADYDALLKPHADEHGDMFRRVTLDLGHASDWAEKPVEEFLGEIRKEGATSHFVEAVHAMGRYLLISTSGRYPAPLQGIWGADWRPEWGGSFTTDTNVNLAISASSMGNLPECAESYFGFVERQLPGWRANAKYHFGCRGIAVPVNTDPETGYATHFTPGHPHMYWSGGAVWNIRPFYDHAILTGDMVFMKERVLPLYLELSDFYEDFLEKGEDGRYHIIPSISQENIPSNANGKPTEDSTYDVAVARELFTILLELGERFQLPAGDLAKWRNYLDNLPDYRINGDGALAEWAPERYNDNYRHRHNSHLYPVFPGMEFLQPDFDPALVEAARVALKKRLKFDTSSAHGLVYAAMMATRLQNLDKVKTNLRRFATRRFLSGGLVSAHYPNNKVYNLDASLSLPRLIMEMLVFSRPGYIRLLPTWPQEYPDGSMKGVLIRGGHKMDIAWKDGELLSATLYAGADESCQISYGDKTRSLDLKAGQTYQLDGRLGSH